MSYQIRIVRRQRVNADGVMDISVCTYGIVIMTREGEELYAPVYPYVSSVNDVYYLAEFLAEYEERLIKHYVNGSRRYFSRFLFDFDTGLKERFKERWWKKGVIID